MPIFNKLTVSVIIPVHNGGENFRRCLSSLNGASPQANEIIVVADGDTDGSWRLAEKFGAKVLRNPVTQGPAHARNLGAQTAQGDILFFVDADVVIAPEAIRKVESAFSNDPQLTALFGSYDEDPAETNFLSQYKNLFHHYVHQMSQEEASTFWSGCGAIRRRIFMELGGFAESYRAPSVEDIELGYRLKKAGYRILLCKGLHVKHLKHWGVSSLIQSDFFLRALPWTQLILRDRRFIDDLNVRLTSRVSVMLTYGFLAALAGGYWWLGSFVLASVLALLLLTINMPVYKFFLRKRGIGFMIRTIPWHWFYYFYSGLAFAIGVGRYLFSRGKSPGLKLSSIPKGLSDTTQPPE